MSRWVPHKIDNISKEKGVIPSRGSGHGKGHSFSRNVHVKMLGPNWEVIYRVIEKVLQGTYRIEDMAGEEHIILWEYGARTKKNSVGHIYVVY